jgi:hypothetical protein
MNVLDVIFIDGEIGNTICPANPPFPLDTAIIRGLLRNFIPFLPLLHVFKAVPLP